MTNEGGRVTRVLGRHQVPDGFPLRFVPPDSPIPVPAPAATLVLMREGRGGLEVLLLERSARSRFIPGAYVFPGGRIDPGDADPELLNRLGGLDPRRLRRESKGGGGDPPALAYRVAALRETFEETGLLLAGAATAHPGTSPYSEPRLSPARAGLLEGRMSFKEVLLELGVLPDAATPVYFANWLTPESEPLRFDTRFFAVQVPSDATVDPFSAEVARALWLTPEEALRRNADGTLPLVFPTLRTLEALQEFSKPACALLALEQGAVRKQLPKLVPVPGGIGIILGS